jgi:hypothetical protein
MKSPFISAVLRRFFYISKSAGVFLFIYAVLFSAGMAYGQGEIDVQQPIGTSLTDGGSVSFGFVAVGGSSTKTFQVKNAAANGILSGLSLSKTGTNQGDFSYTQLSGSLAPGGTTTFNVTFSPVQTGSRTAILRVASTDANENPFDINLSGGAQAPDIAVLQGATNLTSGVSTVNFGRVNVGSTATRNITIRNAGTGNLTDLSLDVSGGGFSSGNLTTTTLGSGASTTVAVRFAPTSESGASGTLTIFSNDDDENPFVVSLTGSGVQPWLEVEQPEGTALANGFAIVDYGTTEVGLQVSNTFTIRNVGGGELTNIRLNLTGANAGDFVRGALPSTSLAVNATLQFTVTFAPTAEGERNAVIEAVSDQTASNPFAVNLKGTASGISVFADLDGDGTPNLVETATGTDPAVGGPPPGVLTKNGDKLEFLVSRSKDAIATIALSLQYADTLAGPWTSVDESHLDLIADDETSQQVKFTIDAGSAGRRYVRLGATKR